MKKEIEKLLTTGLKHGFGEGRAEDGFRNGFPIKVVHFADFKGNIYHDEWTPGRLGGGQEIVEFKGDKFTRLYAGGTLEEEKLAELGIDEKAVMKFLKGQILENRGKMRLFENFDSQDGSEWVYQYRVIDQIKELGLVIGRENIFYNGSLVFVHGFLLSPIR